MSRTEVALVVALVAIAAPVVRAEGPDAAVGQAVLDQARKLFEDGKRLLDQGRYGDAILAYESSFALAPREEVVFALAFSHHQKYIADGDPANLRRAVKLYREYLAMPRHAKQQKRVIEGLGQLEPQLRRLDEDAARNVVVEPPAPPPPAPTVLIVSSAIDGARVVVDGVEHESPAVVTTSAGRHEVSVSAPGYKPAKRDAVAIEHETVSVDVPLAELPGTLVVRSDPDATLVINGKPSGQIGAPLDRPAGRYRLGVLRRGRYADVREITLARGGRLTVEVPLQVTAQRRASRYVLIGSAGLLVTSGVAAALAWSAQADARDFDERVSTGASLTESERRSYNAAIERRDWWRTTAGLVAGASAVAAITGTLLYLLDSPRVDTRLPAVVPSASAGGVGAVWWGTF